MSYGIKLVGVGSYKHAVVSNEDFIKVFGRKAAFADGKLFFKTRYSSIDIKTGKVAVTNTDMACGASKAALDMAGLKPDDIDMIIYSSSTPDYPLPPSFTILQEKLNIKKCMGLDIRSGCCGLGTALITARQFLITGMCQRALVVGADLTTSRFTFLYEKGGVEKFPLKAVFNMMLFGDAAGALILERTSEDNNEIYNPIMGSSRAYRPFGSYLAVGGSITPFPDKNFKDDELPIIQNMLETETRVPEVIIDSIEEFLQKGNLTIENFDYYVFPVESEMVGKKFCEHFKVSPEKIITAGSEGGSLVNAAVPLGIEKGMKQKKITKGTNILLFAAENTRWQYAVMGYRCGL